MCVYLDGGREGHSHPTGIFRSRFKSCVCSCISLLQDMVTTGFKRGMVDKETSTDSSLFQSASSSKRDQTTATVATQVECGGTYMYM